MEMLFATLMSLLPSIPSLIVDGALLALAVSRWNRHPRVSMLAATAGVMLLVLDVVSRVAFTLLPMKLHESGRTTAELGVTYAIMGGISGLLHAVAMGLLVGAVFAERGGVSPARGLTSFSER